MKGFWVNGFTWVLLQLAGAAWAQPANVLTPADAPYDPKTECTIEGEVVKSGTGIYDGVRGLEKTDEIVLRLGQQNLPVILAPHTFLEQQNFRVEAGDRVRVTGSRITIRGEPAMVAREVRKGDQVVAIRSGKGTPLWINPGGLAVPD